jgi:hypothetical protein
MFGRVGSLVFVLGLLGVCGFLWAEEANAGKLERLEVELARRDVASGETKVERAVLDASKVGVVVVDVWNWHWCKTATARVGALVPRMNRALEGARELGMTVMLCPTDVVENYVGWPQREVVLAMAKVEVPSLTRIDCPAPPDGGGCACGKERCVVNYGWSGMHPDLRIEARDLMPDSLAEVYSICKERGLTHLIYMGVHTQVCLLGKPMGLRNLKAAGMDCILARDLTDAHPGYDPARGFTPDKHTAEVVAHFERYLAPSIDFDATIARGRRDTRPSTAVDPVRITPWGTPGRPHLFEREVVVTLSAPLQQDATIHYTVDGTAPTVASAVYREPITIRDSTTIRAVGFAGERAVCTESIGRFDHLPALPPRPDIHLSDLTPLRAVGPSHTYANQQRFSAHSGPPRPDVSNEGKPLRLRRKDYAKGMGVHAPCQLMYELEPEYDRFVALAGVDERILEVAQGSNVGHYPSVVFKVFIDGRQAAESPVMRIAEQPWRFDVVIPAGARLISLIATDAGDGNREDLANWVDAGFVVKEARR